MTIKLAGQQELAATAAWLRTFNSTDPFGWPFEDVISSGRVLYPTDGCLLFVEQFRALRFAAAEMGESTCYLAVVEGKAALGEDDDASIYELNLDDFNSYSELNLTLENAIFSISGGWGLLISHEMHAVMGGTSRFIAAFDKIDSAAEAQWRAFSKEWQADKHREWLDGIASRVEFRGQSLK